MQMITHRIATLDSSTSEELAQEDEPDCPLSPPKAQRDVSLASSPFLTLPSSDIVSSSEQAKKKDRFIAKAPAIIGGEKAKETIIPRPVSNRAELRTHSNESSPDISDDSNNDNHNTYGMAHVIGMDAISNDFPRRRYSSQSYDSYISDASSSSVELDDYTHDDGLSPNREHWDSELSPDINMTYSPEHPHLSLTLNRQHVSFEEIAINPDFEQLQQHPEEYRRSSSDQITGVRPPSLKMRCNSDPLFSSRISGTIGANNLNIANYPLDGYDKNDWAVYSSSAVYSSDGSESMDEDLRARTSTPHSLNEVDIPSGRKVPININSTTSTPTQAGGARHFYSNQKSAQRVAELQASAPLVHRPYLDQDGSDVHSNEGLTKHNFPNTDSFLSTTGNGQDHMYWRQNPAYSPYSFGDELQPSRWSMLIYMSLLNLLSGWICFSIAPVAPKLGENINSEILVSFFLIGNAFATSLTPVLITYLGVRRTVLLGALLLLVGLSVCVSSVIFERFYIGFIIAGVSQPLYQLTPIFVVTSWFPPGEHTTMLRTILQSNQLGIMFSFLCGTFLVSSENDIITYFQCIIFITSILFIAMIFCFEEAPPRSLKQKKGKDTQQAFLQQSPSKASDEESIGSRHSSNERYATAALDFSLAYTEKLEGEKGHQKMFSYGSIEPTSPFPILQGSFTPLSAEDQLMVLGLKGLGPETVVQNRQVVTLMMTGFSKESFGRYSFAFITTCVIANCLITFMASIVGISESNEIFVGAVGSAFQLFMMISPLVVERRADPYHRHSLLSASLLAGVVAMMMCMIAMEWGSSAGLISGILTVSFILGASQSLSLARGIEISQMNESSVLAIFRLLSNVLSSIAIPLFRFLQADSIAEAAPDFSLPFIFLIAMNMIAATCFIGGNRRIISSDERKTERYPFLPSRRTLA